MTFKEALIKHLADNGMFPDQADSVFAQYSADNDSMVGRWNDEIEGYPDIMLNVLVMGINSEAVRWIDKCLPKAWYRPMFAT